MNGHVLNNHFSRFWRNKKNAITWTNTHAKCEWDHLWNDSPQKPTFYVHIGKSHFFQVVHSVRHSNIGCGVHLPHVMTKLEMDENLVGLIQTNKVSCAKGFNLFGILQIGWDLHPKRSVERRLLHFWITMN